MNRKGFGLVEVIIVTLILGILGASLNSLLSHSLKFSKNIEAKTEFASMVKSVEFALQNEALCPSTLFNKRSLPDSTAVKFDPNKNLDERDLLDSIRIKDTVVVQLGGVYPSFSIISLSLSELDSAQRQLISPTQIRYLVKLHMEGKKNAQESSPYSLAHDFFMSVVTKDSTIEKCSLSSTTHDTSSTSGGGMSVLAFGEMPENLNGGSSELHSVQHFDTSKSGILTFSGHVRSSIAAKGQLAVCLSVDGVVCSCQSSITEFTPAYDLTVMCVRKLSASENHTISVDGARIGSGTWIKVSGGYQVISQN